MDAILHRERLDGRNKRLQPIPGDLPTGAMLAAGGGAWLIVRGVPWRWGTGGYGKAVMPAADGLLTPPSTLAALAAGYRPRLHASVS